MMDASTIDMSVWGLVRDASLLVQGVMLSLLAASIASWYLIVRRGAMYRQEEESLHSFQNSFRASTALEMLHRDLDSKFLGRGGLENIFKAGYQEFNLLRCEPAISNDAIVEGVERALLVAIAEQEERLGKSLAVLATIGSVSPYVGLFGTVWGIMTAFMGLAQVQQATLAVVAPGIAEALIATAIGLFAAIPAVMAYNRYSARSQALISAYYRFGNELQMRLHRTLHGVGGHSSLERPYARVANA